MRKIVVLIYLFSYFISFSQEKSFHNYYWNTDDNYQAIVGVTNCYVRNNPSINAVLLDSLQLGKAIKVIKSTNNDLKIKGINVSWVEIEYTNKAGILSNGYLWKGFLAIGYSKKNEFTYLTVIEKIETTNKEDFISQNFFISAKILDSKNFVIAQNTIQKNIGESIYFENKTIGSLGLTNLKDIYRISFNGEACGIPSMYYYFGWNGNKLLLLPEKYSVGDAGAYYHDENFIFPKEKGGKPDLIIKQIKEGENIDDSGESDEMIFKVTEYKEFYKWNGEKAILIKKIKGKIKIEKL
jgi:hypothetical protein